MLSLEQIRGRRLSELKILLDEARMKMLDLSFVFKKFSKKFYEIVETNWNIRGSMFGKKWVRLSPKYAKWKKKHYGNSQANLILTGRLQKASLGKSSESYLKIEKLKMEIGIKGIPYARVHQWGFQNIPQRPYWLMKDGSIHPRLERFFKLELVKHIGLNK